MYNTPLVTMMQTTYIKGEKEERKTEREIGDRRKMSTIEACRGEDRRK